MKILIAYYSRTGMTKKVAEAIKESLQSFEEKQVSLKLQSDIEEIVDTKNRSGAIGYLYAGRDAMKNKLTKLAPLKFNPLDYDLAIVGTPIWSFTVSTPVRTYLSQNKNNFKRVAFYCTQGGRGAETAFSEMEKCCGAKPLATLALTTKDVATNNFQNSLEKYIAEVFDSVSNETKK